MLSQNLKKLSFLLIFTLFWGMSPLRARASLKIDAADDLVELYSKDFSAIKIHAAPSAKSKVICELDVPDELYAEAAPIIDKGDNSKWYKIILIAHYADFLRQVHKLAEFNYSYGYVSAKYVNTNDTSNEYLKEEMARIRAGRPPRKKVGDDFRAEGEFRTKRTLKVPVTLLKEPKEGAEKIKIPAGLKYVSYAEETEDNFPVYYNDINEVDWALIVRADTYKVIGWMKAEEWGNIPLEKK